MTAFQFRLQAILDQRTEEKRQTEELLASRERELAVEQRTMKELEDEQQRTEERYQRKSAERFGPGVYGGSTFSKRSDLLNGLKLDVQAAQAGVLSQQVFVDQATDLLREAQFALKERQLAVDVLEKYRQRAEKRFLQEAAYREELEQDEIGNMMHISRRART